MKNTIDIFTNIRNILETYWDDSTKYEKTNIFVGDPLSKGQCGVTSAFLGTRLENMGYKVLFCEGDVYFEGNTPPICNHCWLQINSGNQTIIIDLTVDQSGYKEKILCRSDLENNGIFYKKIRSFLPSQIQSDNLLKRLNFLENKIKSTKNLEILLDQLQILK